MRLRDGRPDPAAARSEDRCGCHRLERQPDPEPEDEDRGSQRDEGPSPRQARSDRCAIEPIAGEHHGEADPTEDDGHAEPEGDDEDEPETGSAGGDGLGVNCAFGAGGALAAPFATDAVFGFDEGFVARRTRSHFSRTAGDICA